MDPPLKRNLGIVELREHRVDLIFAHRQFRRHVGQQLGEHLDTFVVGQFARPHIGQGVGFQLGEHITLAVGQSSHDRTPFVGKPSFLRQSLQVVRFDSVDGQQLYDTV